MYCSDGLFVYWYQKDGGNPIGHGQDLIGVLHNYRNVLDKYVLPKLGIYKLHKITPATVQEFIDEVATSTEYKRDGKTLAK